MSDKPIPKIDPDSIGLDKVAGMNDAVKQRALRLPSRHKKPTGEPAVVYRTEAERERGDKIYKVRIVNIELKRDAGRDSVNVNGFHVGFHLGAETEMPGFCLDSLRAATYMVPKVVEVDGHPKIKGWERRSSYSIDMEF